MRLATLTLAASFVIAPAAFTASFAQTAAVSYQTFDWIFFVIIVPLPFMALFDTLINDGLHPGDPEGVARRYPPTITDGEAARPFVAGRTPEDEEVIAEPRPGMPHF